MKLPPFNHTERKFDRFNMFYNEADHSTWWGYHTNPFILLETGEFFLNRAKFSPDRRRPYKDLNISIYGSTDPAWSNHLKNKGARLMTPDGSEVTKAWLNQGSYQTLIIDHDTNHVVHATYAGGWRATEPDSRIPVRLRGFACAYWAGEKEPPVGRAPLTLSEPDPLSKADQQHVDSIVAACKAWNTLSEESQPRADYSSWSTVLVDEDGGRKPNPYYIAPGAADSSKLLDVLFTDLTWGEKKRIAARGVKPRRKITEVTHLIIT